MKGFSLIELLIVLIIVGILTCFAYPGYQAHILRAKRLEAQTALLDLASQLERYYFDNHTYESATIGSGRSSDVLSSAMTSDGHYVLSITHASTTTFGLKATPSSSYSSNDSVCQSLTLNSRGIKGIASGPSGSPTGPVNQCW